MSYWAEQARRFLEQRTPGEWHADRHRIVSVVAGRWPVVVATGVVDVGEAELLAAVPALLQGLLEELDQLRR